MGGEWEWGGGDGRVGLGEGGGRLWEGGDGGIDEMRLESMGDGPYVGEMQLGESVLRIGVTIANVRPRRMDLSRSISQSSLLRIGCCVSP